MKYLIIVLLLTGSIAAHSGSLPSNGYYWFNESMHVSTGDLAVTGAASNDWQAAFDEAADRWNNTAIPFTVTTDTAVVDNLACADIPANAAHFSSSFCGAAWGRGLITQTFRWFFSDGELTSVYLVFNSSETWDVYDGDLLPVPLPMDFTRAAAFTIGEAIGLSYSETPDALMARGFGDTIAPQNDDVAAVNTLYNIHDVVLLPDINNSGSDEVAAFRMRATNTAARTQVREASNGSRLRSMSFFSGYRPRGALLIDDLNGNNTPELVVYQERNTDGRVLAEARDPNDGSLAGTLWFSREHRATGHSAALDDIDGNGSQELALMLIRLSDFSVVVQVRDLGTRSIVRQLYYSADEFYEYPLDMAVVPDLGDGPAPEIAVLMYHTERERNLVQLRDSGTGALVTNIWLPPTHTARNISVVDDVNNDGVDDIATLFSRNSDGAIGIRISDSVTGSSLSLSYFRTSGHEFYTKRALLTVPDLNGNGSSELAVLTQRSSSQRTILDVRDSLTGGRVGSVFISPDFDAQSMLLLPDANGNGTPDVGIYGFAGNFKNQVAVYDPTGSGRLNTLYFPNLLMPGQP